MVKNKDYWSEHWKTHSKLDEKHPQLQVARTKEGKIISNNNWQKTVQSIFKIIQIKENQIVLDLCCGNGLLSKELAWNCKKVVSVDYSQELLDKFVTKAGNIEKMQSNALNVQFDNNNFDVIIIYFAIQHFTEQEAIELIGKCKNWLKPGGKLLVGDIPELEKKWEFYSTKKYRVNYISSIIKDEPIIGTWFSREFYKSVGEYYNFSETNIIDQEEFMINHNIRFDVLYEK